jgi:hypothetical protein
MNESELKKAFREEHVINGFEPEIRREIPPFMGGYGTGQFLSL